MSDGLLWVFIPTIAAVSLTPGMCMTLAFSLGLTQGYRRTLWMMLGEMAGVAVVVSTTVLLLAWLLTLDPTVVIIYTHAFYTALIVIRACTCTCRNPHTQRCKAECF